MYPAMNEPQPRPGDALQVAACHRPGGRELRPKGRHRPPMQFEMSAEAVGE